VEIILSILLSFLVFLAYLQLINVQLSAIYYEFGIMSEFCMQKTYNTLYCILCISLFYDSLRVLQAHWLSLVLLLGMRAFL
jgi:hypothetical protein